MRIVFPATSPVGVFTKIQQQKNPYIENFLEKGVIGVLLLAGCTSLATTKKEDADDSRLSYRSHNREIEIKPFQQFNRLMINMTSILSPALTCCESFGASRILESDSQFPSGYTEQERFATCLEYHRVILSDYERRWNYSRQNTSAKTRKRTTWPKNVPMKKDIKGLEIDLGYCERSPDYRSHPCQDIKFRVAAFYVQQKGNHELQQKGFKMIKELAEHGHPDGMCLYGILLAEGCIPGVDVQPKQAVVWWRRCVDFHKHIKASFELGVALYTGEGVAENPQEAVQLFRRTAHLGHAGAAYMLGECLLDGVGAQRDRAEALEWLITAAELGHQLARERVIQILQHDYEHLDAGDVEREESLKWVNGSDEEKVQMVNVERRYTIGGGVRNPEVLARRQTKVDESRDRAPV